MKGDSVPESDILPSSRPQADPRVPGASPKKVLAIVCVGIVLANLDLFIVNVALPTIAGDFPGATLESLSWILNGYAITYAALLVFFGRLAERFRRNRSFMLGVALFTAASAACAAAGSVNGLVAARVVASGGGGADDAHLDRLTARGVSAGTPWRRGAHLGRGRWLRRGAWATCRRRARRRELALDLPGQHSYRRHRACPLLAGAAGVARPRREGAQPLGSHARHGWDRRPDVLDHEAERLGVALARGRPERRGLARLPCPVRPALPWCGRPVHQPRAVSHPVVQRRGPGDGALLGCLRRLAVLHCLVGANGLGMVSLEDRLDHRARPHACPRHLALAGGG